jgi:hypothetical protein
VTSRAKTATRTPLSGVVALAIIATVALVVIVDLSTQLRRRWVLLGGQ